MPGRQRGSRPRLAGHRAGAADRRPFRRRSTATRSRSCSSAPRATARCSCPGRRFGGTDPAHWQPPAGQARHPGSAAAAPHGPGGPAPAGTGRATGPVPRRVLPAAAPARAGGVVRRVVHPAGRLRPDAGAPCRLRRRARAHRLAGSGPTRWARRRVRFPLASSAADEDVRDPAQERAALDALDLPPFAIGLLRADGPGTALLPRRHGSTGLDTMRLSTEVLPLLADADGSSSRSAAAGRLPGGGRLAADRRVHREVAGETDWFDLGVTISVEGRDVPFADVFVALAAGESHLLLPDGAYFSLAEARAAGAAHAHRGGAGAAGLADGPAADQPVPGGPVGGAGRARRRRRARRRAWQQQVAGLLSLDTAHRHATPAPRLCARSCGPTSATGSTGCASCGEHRLGGILADDMGLGKTLQSLALICHAQAR